MTRPSLKERMEIAAKAAFAQRPKPPKILSPTEQISQAAEEIASGDQVAQNLSRALDRALNAGAIGNNPPLWGVDCHFLIDRMQYHVRIGKMGMFARTQDFLVDDEALAINTADVALFKAWVTNVAHHMKVFFPSQFSDWAQDSGSTRNREVTTNTLRAYGVHVGYEHAPAFQWEPSEEDLVREEQAALESIRKAARGA